MSKPSLVILAAGLGSRYGSLKQLAAFGPHGETLLEYSVYDAMRAGFGKIVFIIRRAMAAEFTEVVVRKIEQFVPVELVFQELENIPGTAPVNPARQKPWGTGHALWSAAGQVQEPFAVINADDFYGPAAFAQVAAYLQTPTSVTDLPAWCLVGYPLRNTLSPHGAVSRALCQVDAHGNLQAIKELKEITAHGATATAMLPDGQQLPLNGQEIVSMNFWGFTPAVFPVLERYLVDFLREQGQTEKGEFYLSEAANQMLAARLAQIAVLPSADQWLGVTYPADKAAVQQQLTRLTAQGAYPALPWRKNEAK